MAHNDHLAFYKFIIDNLPVGVITMDSELRVTQLNPWGEKLTGYASGEAIGRHCGEVLQSGKCGLNCPLRTIIDGGKSVVQTRTSIKNKRGENIPVRINAAALFDKDGGLIGGVEALVDISHLVALEREKANLISMVAHDMRSSLTGIHGLSLRLLRRPTDLDETREKQHLEIITKEAAKLESLVDDFLEFSRLETGSLCLNFSTTSLDKELEEIFETYQIRAAQYGVNLELRVDAILPVVEVDAQRLRRVFCNLLDNAIKFSRKGGAVAMSARETEHEVMISVADNGIGIHPEDLPYIFDVFHRGRTIGKREGHGLGLATAKIIVEGHGGRILVASQVNEGSTFTLFLPKDRSDKKSTRLEFDLNEEMA
jgi:PAS domain S-box-containing protein